MNAVRNRGGRKSAGNRLEACVFPVAGLGVRFMPATKNTPKEMLPLVDRPLIHHGVTEAVDSGCRRIIFVTGVGKGSIRDYFSSNPQLVKDLRDKGYLELADRIDDISRLADFSYVGQPSPRGLGDAIRCAAEACLDFDYFGVILPDDVMKGQVPALAQLDAVRRTQKGSVLALERVPRDQVSRYGIAETEEVSPGIHKILSLTEKPAVESAKSNLAVMGRYVLSAGIFKHLEKLKPGSGGEYQLTDALAAMLVEEPLWGVECDAIRYDCGTIPGWIEANCKLSSEFYSGFLPGAPKA